MKYLKRFFDGIQRDLRIFLFMLVLLEIYRAVFMLIMSNYINDTTGVEQIYSALWTGLRLSLKTAGAVTAFSFLFVSILGFTPRLRLAIGIFFSLIFSTLFMMRFPYYKAFHSTYGMEVLQGLNDDIISIIVTVVQEYGLFWRFPVAFILTVICIAILSRLLIIKTFPLPELKTLTKKILFVTGLAGFIVTFGIFVRFGGSLNYAGGVNWENAGVTSDDFLNECILDDGQALYRVKTMSKLMQAGEVPGVDPNNIAVCAELISQRKNLNADNLSMYLERTAQGAKIKLKGLASNGGDLYVNIQITAKAPYTLDGTDIYYDLNITPWTAALGGTASVYLPDNSSVNIKIPANARSEQKLKLSGRGLGKSGNFYVRLLINNPEHLTSRQKELFRELAK